MYVRVGWARSSDGTVLAPPQSEWQAAKRDPKVVDHITEVFDADGKVDPDKLEEWLLNHRIGNKNSQMLIERLCW